MYCWIVAPLVTTESSNHVHTWVTKEWECLLAVIDERSPLVRNNDKVRNLRADVADVKEILRDNIEKVVERDGKIQALDERAGTPVCIV